MSFELPDLPFDPKGFGDWTSEETFSYHHGKHHAGYVKKLNAAVEGTEWAEKDITEVISANRSNPGIFNNAAQHYNHSFFWNCLTPEGGSPEGKLAELIERDFGSLDALKEQFTETATKHFASGWAWLVQNPDGTLAIKDYHDADTPADSDSKPLLTLDVWEHAYYIDHRNDRGAFVNGFWSHVNWKYVSQQLGE